MASAIHRTVFLFMGIGFAALIVGCTGKKPANEAEAWFKVDPKTAGTVTGSVRFAGKKPLRKQVDMNGDPQCAKLHQSPVSDDVIAANDEGKLANVFIYIKQGLEGKNFEPPANAEMPAVMDQKGCWFGPRVLGVQVGQTLKVTNSDPLTHNIHPLAQINREWNQSQSPTTEPLTRRFSQPEVMIRVKCNIHSWMQAWIGVVPHPYFAVTGADGSFQLRDVPPGTYTIQAWQEQLGRQEQQIFLSPSGKSDIVFEFKGE
ncbi:MAG: carboxypeptidase regulatory-like domain-containing protein [Blastocatellia bacterium]